MGRSLGRIPAATVVVLAAFAATGRSAAAEVDWTRRPTRIDRAAQDRERLPSRAAIGAAETPPRLVLRTDDFPLLGADASFRAEGRRWRLAHVVLPERSRSCPSPEGPGWACGVRAWAQVAAFLVRRRLTCDPPIETADAPPGVDCRIAGVSVAVRLAERGWVEPAPEAGSDVVAAHRRAVAARRGLFAERAPE